MTDREVMQQALEALTIYSDAQCSLKGQAAITALRTALEQPEQEPVAWMSSDRAWMWSDYSKALAAVAHIPRLTLIPLYTAPPEWPLVKNILDEYGLQAISFVADWKAAQSPWVGLTDEDWEHIDNKKGTALDTFAQGAVWAEVQLRERNT